MVVVTYYLRGACASAFFAAGQGRLRCFKLCSLLGRVALSLCIVAYPAATTAAVRMLDCVEVAVPQTPATSNALDGAPDITQQATAQKLILLSVLRTNPYFVCWSGSHREAGVLAAAAIAFFVLGFPLTVLAWLVCPALFSRRQGSGSDAPRVPKFRSKRSWRRAADRTCIRCAPRGEPDQLFAPVVSDFLPVAWYTKFIDLALLLLLSVLHALLPSPETVETVALKAGLSAAAALAVAAHVALFRPYEFVERWKGPVRVLLLLVSACSSILNGASTAVQRGWAAPPSLPESVTVSSYLLLALWVVALIVLFAGFGYALWEEAVLEARGFRDDWGVAKEEGEGGGKTAPGGHSADDGADGAVASGGWVGQEAAANAVALEGLSDAAVVAAAAAPGSSDVRASGGSVGRPASTASDTRHSAGRTRMGYLDPHRRRRQGGGATGSVGRASSSAGRAALSHLPGVAEGADAAASQRALLLPSRNIAADLDGAAAAPLTPERRRAPVAGPAAVATGVSSAGPGAATDEYRRHTPGLRAVPVASPPLASGLRSTPAAQSAAPTEPASGAPTAAAAAQAASSRSAAKSGGPQMVAAAASSPTRPFAI